MAKSDFEFTPCEECPYSSVEDVGALVFMDKHFSVPATKGTFDFLSHLFNHHPYDLHFLYLKSQEYYMIENSQKRMSFERYVAKVRRGLEQYQEEHNG